MYRKIYAEQFGKVTYPKEEDRSSKGPSYISPEGYVGWKENGLLHRMDGPAFLVTYTGKAYYYLWGTRLNHQEFLQRRDAILCKNLV